MKLIKTASGKQLKISKEEWKSIGKKAGWSNDISSSVAIDSALNGMPNAKARKIVQKVISQHGTGLYSDDYWAGVKEVWDLLDNNNIEHFLTDTEYYKDESGNPSGKIYKFEVPFINDKGKETTLYGNLTAAGAGTVQDPLSRYDITVVVG